MIILMKRDWSVVSLCGITWESHAHICKAMMLIPAPSMTKRGADMAAEEDGVSTMRPLIVVGCAQ